MKRDNRGFSLVELVVVVLIMAIIAVILSAAVMKWVNNSRNSSDVQTRNSLKDNVAISLTNVDAFKAVKNGGYRIIITKDDHGNITYWYDGDLIGGDHTKPNPENPYWKFLLETTACADFTEFEKRFTIKSEPASGQTIAINVTVYNEGFTEVDLIGIENEDIDLS